MTWLGLVVRRTLDVYLKRPLIWDIVLGTIVGGFAYYGNTRFCFDTKDITSIQNSFAGTAISLAGFILTSLTIITALRANLSYKGIEKSTSGLELILNSWAYKTIVGVFKVAILELVIVAVLLYATMLFNKIDSYLPFFVALSSGALVAIAFTTLRCLYILFNLIDLEIKGREEASDPLPKPKKWRMQLEILNKRKGDDSQFPKDFTLEMIEEEVERKFKPYND